MGSDLSSQLLEMSARALSVVSCGRYVISKQCGLLSRASGSKIALALGCVRSPGVSSIRVFEYCVKDLKRSLYALCLITIFEKFANFVQTARLARRLMLVKLVKLNRFVPYLELPAL